MELENNLKGKAVSNEGCHTKTVTTLTTAAMQWFYNESVKKIDLKERGK